MSVPIIIDTDVGSDVGNATVLSLLANFQSNGEANILAVGTCTPDKYDASCASAIFTYQGLPSIPIGIHKDSTLDLNDFFAQDISENTNWPNNWSAQIAADTFDNADIDEAVSLIREKLAAADDASVVYWLGGPMTLASAVLNSVADGHSALNGSDLIALKVSKLVVMAGDFPTSSTPEWNIEQDITAAQDVAVNWPTPRVWIGFTFGGAQKAGRVYSRYDPSGPVNRAMVLFDAALASTYGRDGRQTWDEVAAVYAVRGLALGSQTYFAATAGAGNARVVIDGDGNTTWTAGATAINDTYLGLPTTLTNAALGGIIDAMHPFQPTVIRSAYDRWFASLPNLVAYWPLNETGVAGCPTETVYDALGVAHGALNLATIGTSWLTQNTPITSVQPDKSTKGTGTGRADLGLPFAPGTGAFSMCMWLKWSTTTNQYMFLFGNNASGSLHDFGINSSNFGHTAYGLSTVTAAAGVADGNPHFVVYTYAGGTNGATRLYVDGVQVATSNRTFNTAAGIASIGGYGGLTSTAAYMAKVGVFSVELTAAQVLAFYKMARSSFFTAPPLTSSLARSLTFNLS